MFFFSASQLEPRAEFWISNGLPEKTGRLNDLFPEIESGFRNQHPIFCADDTGAYFLHPDAMQVMRLWRYNPGEEHLRPLAEVPGLVGEMVLFGDRLIFPMFEPGLGIELWTYDPAVGEIQLVKDLWAGNDSSNPEHLFPWKDGVYFRADSMSDGIELWRTDGTERGTLRVIDINPHALSSGAYGFVPAGDYLFFRAYHNDYGDELWATKGEIGKMPVVFDVFPGSQSSHPYSMAAIGSYLFFTADDGSHGEELWAIRLDAIENGPFLVEDIREGPESSEPHDLTVLGENAALFVHNSPTGDVLMKLDVIDREITLTPYTGLHLRK